MVAKKKFVIHAQTSKEPYITYIRDVLASCRKVERELLEEEKVGRILRGIADDTVSTRITQRRVGHSRMSSQAKCRRIVHEFDRLPNLAVTSSCEDRANH